MNEEPQWEARANVFGGAVMRSTMTGKKMEYKCKRWEFSDRYRWHEAHRSQTPMHCTLNRDTRRDVLICR